MNKTMKKWFIAAAILIFSGLILFSAVMSVYGWDFSRLGSENYETNTKIIAEDFKDISINTKTSDILFLPSEDGECRVVCYEEKKAAHEVYVEDGALRIDINDERAWYDLVGFGFQSPKITVYLPKDEYGTLTLNATTGDVDLPKDFSFKAMDLALTTGDVKSAALVEEKAKITLSTGDVRIENTRLGSLELSMSTGRLGLFGVVCLGDINVSHTTGDARLNGVDCRSLIMDGSTGDTDMTGVIAEKEFRITTSTGDVEFSACDAAEIFIKTDTGDVEGSLLSEKVFIISTTTGDIEVPKTDKGGRCEIITTTGDIEIDLSRRAYN